MCRLRNIILQQKIPHVKTFFRPLHFFPFFVRIHHGTVSACIVRTNAQIKTDSRFSYRVASLTMPRDILYARIEQRIDQMLADGLAQEVSRLLKNGVPRDAKAMKAIGYKEMIPYALGETTLDEAVYALKLNTRHYAKRQLTWMRREEDVLWVDALEPDAYDKLEAYYTQGEAK